MYFGDPECSLCRSVIEQAIKYASENSVEKIYYVRIWNGFYNEKSRDVYELNNGKPTIKSKGTDAYCKLLSYFDGILEDYTLTAENKNIIKIDEKRIFAPSFIFVRKGNA